MKHFANYLGAHVGWKVARAFDAEAKRRGKRLSPGAVVE
jgi:hypothetical protein